MMNMVIVPSVLLFAICAVATIVGYWISNRRDNYRKQCKLRNLKFVNFPNVMWYALLGKRVETIKSDYLCSQGNVFGFEMFNQLTVMLAEPELIQLVLNKEFASFVNRRVSLLQFAKFFYC